MWVIVWSVLSSFKSQHGINRVRFACCRLFVQQKTGVKHWGQSDLGFVVSCMKGQVRQTRNLKAFTVWEASFLHELILFTDVLERRARGGLGRTGKDSVILCCGRVPGQVDTDDGGQVMFMFLMGMQQISHCAQQGSRWAPATAGERCDPGHDVPDGLSTAVHMEKSWFWGTGCLRGCICLRRQWTG